MNCVNYENGKCLGFDCMCTEDYKNPTDCKIDKGYNKFLKEREEGLEVTEK